MQAKMAAALGRTDDATVKMENLAAESGPVTPDALVALVESLAGQNLPVTFAQVQALEEFLKERSGGSDEVRFRHALVLAQAASGDFDSAFTGLALTPDTAAQVWQLLARNGSDSALLNHAVLGDTARPPGEAKPVAVLIADRLVTLGLPGQAQRWLHLEEKPPALTVARIALAQGDAQTALTILKTRTEPEALPLRAEALQALGAERAAAEIYASLGQSDQQWSARLRGGDWAALARDGPAGLQATAALLLVSDTSAEGAPPAGPLARDAALVTQSAATRDAIAQLLDTVKSPPPLTP